MSLDPIVGCPYDCRYCVLSHAGNTGKRPEIRLPAEQCLRLACEHPLFVADATCLAIGNETDILHPSNVDYLIDLLGAIRRERLRNPLVLISKAPQRHETMERIRSVGDLRLVFFLSYSGLGPTLEPNFTHEGLRSNFDVVREHGFPVVHFWRPLLPENTSLEAVRRMLEFASHHADATVFVGLKLHPELNRVLVNSRGVTLPPGFGDACGEWLPSDALATIYREARRICPDHPLYRHSSCAMALLLGRVNHTGTAFRDDVCLQSQCPTSQRLICSRGRHIPDDTAIAEALARLGRITPFAREESGVRLFGVFTQEEYAYLVHRLRCPLIAEGITMQNLYRGDIYTSSASRRG